MTRSLAGAILLPWLQVAAGQDIGYELLFKSQLDEFSSQCVKATAPVPSWAHGDFIIPSTGVFEMGDRKVVGQLDAFGKMHRFEMKGDQVCATYRIMASGFYNNSKAENTVASGMLFFETEPPRHCPFYNPLCNLMAPNDNTFVNTIKHGGKLLSLTDDTKLLEIDPTSMAVVGKYHFTDKLDSMVSYASSAHPVKHPSSGNWIDFVGNANILKGGADLAVYQMGEEDPHSRKAMVNFHVDNPPYMHSFGITDKHIILPTMPIKFDAMAVMTGPLHKAFKDVNLTTDPAGVNGFRVLPISGGVPQVHELPRSERLYYTHTINAYENATGTVLDLCTYPKNPFAGNLTVQGEQDKAFRDKSPRALVKRFLIPSDEAAAITSEVISEHDKWTDFTKINPRFNGQKHCFYWGVQWFTDSKTKGAMAIVKYDLCHGATKKQWYRPNWFPSEASFIPATGQDAAEDDGVLVFTALDGVKGETFFMVVDASTMETVSSAGPFARIGFTTHGEFYPHEERIPSLEQLPAETVVV